MSKQEHETVFVIMLSTQSLTRDRATLDRFFHSGIKQAIESGTDLTHNYTVLRSGNYFDISAAVIRYLYSVDIVICDLSGASANASVMYELDVRFSVINKPVILIREDHPAHRQIFEIQWLHPHLYSPMDYHSLGEYLLRTLRALELGQLVYEPAVLYKNTNNSKSVTLASRIWFGYSRQIAGLSHYPKEIMK